MAFISVWEKERCGCLSFQSPHRHTCLLYSLVVEQLKIKFMQIGRLFACMVLRAESLKAKISARMGWIRKKKIGVVMFRFYYYSAYFSFFISFFLKRISFLFEIWVKPHTSYYVYESVSIVWIFKLVVLWLRAVSFDVEKKSEEGRKIKSNCKWNFGIMWLRWMLHCWFYCILSCIFFFVFYSSKAVADLFFFGRHACQHPRAHLISCHRWHRWCAMSFHLMILYF